jgi:hypothetical protein
MGGRFGRMPLATAGENYFCAAVLARVLDALPVRTHRATAKITTIS